MRGLAIEERAQTMGSAGMLACWTFMSSGLERLLTRLTRVVIRGAGSGMCLLSFYEMGGL